MVCREERLQQAQLAPVLARLSNAGLPPLWLAWDPNMQMVQVGGVYYRAEDAEEARLQLRERMEEQARKEGREIWLRGEGGQLCLELYAKFQEYKKWLSRFPPLLPGMKGSQQPEHVLLLEALREARSLDEERLARERERAEQNRKNLEKARQAACCQHLYNDGRQCAAPRLRKGELCSSGYLPVADC